MGVKETAAIPTAMVMRATDIWTSHVDPQTLIEIGGERRGPCVSLFHCIAGAKECGDARAMADLIDAGYDALGEAQVSRRVAHAVLKPAESLLGADQVWKSGARGIAVFASPELFAVVQTGLFLATQVVVGRRFVTRPLLPALEDLTEFEVGVLLNELAGGPRDGRVVANLGHILSAAHNGRVVELYIDRGAQAWGVFNRASSSVESADDMGPKVDDLIDLAAVKTIAHGGRAHVTDRLEFGGEAVPLLAQVLRSRSSARATDPVRRLESRSRA